MKHLIITAMATLTAMGGLIHAQEKEPVYIGYGYAETSADYALEPARYAISYIRRQNVVNGQTKEQEQLTDTLLLVIGNRWSVFYNPEYESRYSSWGRQNIRKTRQATKSVSLKIVPLASVIEKKNASADYVEGNFGEPTVIYKDRIAKKTLSCIYASKNIMAEQKSRFEWKL